MLQMCRTCGGGAPVDVHFCPQCSKLLTLGRHGDYFAFMGLPRKLDVDATDLEQRFRALSRQFHPDFFYNASPTERRASLERSSYLNDAYRTLRHPAERLDYLLQLELPAPTERTDGTFKAGTLPPALLQEFFELNEELDEIRQARVGGAPEDALRPRLERARQPILAKQAAHDEQLAQLSARWDGLVDGAPDAPDSKKERRDVLDALRTLALERTYIGNLLEGIERELSQ
jgi:molecular chaperone HscB